MPNGRTADPLDAEPARGSADFDPDDVIARYMERRANEPAETPASQPPPPQRGFGRKVV
jgi:hypothetical protein